MNVTDETKLAELIVGVLPEGSVVRVCSDDRDSLRYAVRDGKLKLRSVVLRRASLRRLLNDPLAAVKVEYIQRELERVAGSSSEYNYPRPLRKHKPVLIERDGTYGTYRTSGTYR